MPTTILLLLGTIILIVAFFGIISGKVIAGSRGLHPNYYSKRDNPLFYYSFLGVYLLVGSFILYHSI